MLLYRGFVIEWIDYRDDYRVYNIKYPQQTVAYVDTVAEAKEGIDFYLGDCER